MVSLSVDIIRKVRVFQERLYINDWFEMTFETTVNVLSVF